MIIIKREHLLVICFFCRKVRKGTINFMIPTMRLREIIRGGTDYEELKTQGGLLKKNGDLLEAKEEN